MERKPIYQNRIANLHSNDSLLYRLLSSQDKEITESTDTTKEKNPWHIFSKYNWHCFRLNFSKRPTNRKRRKSWWLGFSKRAPYLGSKFSNKLIYEWRNNREHRCYKRKKSHDILSQNITDTALDQTSPKDSPTEKEEKIDDLASQNGSHTLDENLQTNLSAGEETTESIDTAKEKNLMIHLLKIYLTLP